MSEIQFVKNYFKLRKNINMKHRISVEKNISSVKWLLLIIHFFEYLISFYRYNEKSNNIYIYVRNNCLLLVKKDYIKILNDSHFDVMYGDSLVKSAKEQWYESRPTVSPLLLEQYDYVGDIILSKIRLDDDKTFRQNIRKIVNKGAKIHNLECALSLRDAKFFSKYDRPILIDDFEEVVYDSDQKLNRVNFCKTAISIVIPTAFRSDGKFNIANCLNTLIPKLNDFLVEIILVFHEKDSKHFDSLRDQLTFDVSIRAKTYAIDFNFSHAVNLGIKYSKNEILLLLNDDLLFEYGCEFKHAFNHILSNEKIGAVGALLLRDRLEISHAGLYFKNGIPDNYLNGTKLDTLPEITLHCREVSGVTGALILIRKSVIENIGFFDTFFPNDYNDVDLMLRLVGAGYSNLVCTHLKVLHKESMSRGISDVSSTLLDLKLLNSYHGPLPLRDRYLFSPCMRLPKKFFNEQDYN